MKNALKNLVGIVALGVGTYVVVMGYLYGLEYLGL